MKSGGVLAVSALLDGLNRPFNALVVLEYDDPMREWLPKAMQNAREEVEISLKKEESSPSDNYFELMVEMQLCRYCIDDLRPAINGGSNRESSYAHALMHHRKVMYGILFWDEESYRFEEVQASDQDEAVAEIVCRLKYLGP